MQACRSLHLESRTYSDYGTTYLSTQPLQTLRCVQNKTQQITGLTHQSKTLLLHCSLPATFKRPLPLASLQHDWTTHSHSRASGKPSTSVPRTGTCCSLHQGCPNQYRGLLHLTTQRTLSVFKKFMEKFCLSVATYKRTWATRRNTKNSNLTMKNTDTVCFRVGQFKSQWRAVLNTVKSISVPLMAVNFLTSYMPVSISRRNSPYDNTRLLTTFSIIWNASIGEFHCLKCIRF